MYIGREKDGRYNFIDTGGFQLSKDILERGIITIDKDYNGKEANDIHEKYKILQQHKQKKKNKDVR